MKHVRGTFFIALVTGILLNIMPLRAQTDSTSEGAPKIYLDCPSCDQTNIKEEMPFFNYVRDRKVADVHIQSTTRQNGSGGSEITFLFIGQGPFQDINDTLVLNTDPNQTQAEIRDAVNRLLRMGLMRYLIHTPLGEHVNVDFDLAPGVQDVEDPWHYWVFDLGVNGWFDGEENLSSLNSWSNISAKKVTENWKIEAGYSFNYNEDKYIISNQTILGITRRHYLNTEVIKSLGDHWGAGVFGTGRSSLYDNISLGYEMAPSVEYNLFPYSESTRKLLTLSYSISYKHNNYYDTTIYYKTQEDLYQEMLDVKLGVTKNWGGIDLAVNASHYFYDFSKNSVNIHGGVRLRLFKGFNLRVNGGYRFIHDQLELPLSGASEEEILLETQQLATSYSYYGNVGISYTFGSIYNTIVNPRFGNW